MSTRLLSVGAKKSGAAIGIAILMLLSGQLLAQSQQEIVDIFKEKVDGLQDSASNTESEWQITDIRFDVKKTDSLVAPIQGEVSFKAVEKSMEKFSCPYPVRLSLYWSDEEREWIFEKLLSRAFGTCGAQPNPWTNPEKNSGWNFAQKPGFAMEDLINALRKHFSEK